MPKPFSPKKKRTWSPKVSADAPWPQSAGKRLFDIWVSAWALVLLSPLMLIIGAVILSKMGRPVFFRQSRPGKNGASFTLIKFRTLSGSEAETETPGGKIPPNRFCKFLRASGLDELPELWNILKGEMSFVGPRPLLERYLPRYSPEQQKRHHVRPGLTGLAQVNGRNAVDWEIRLRLDVEYVETANHRTDLKILWQTLTLIGRGEGTAEPGEFMGTPHD
ncbi:sugar transferase [Kiritimatiellaeota bacterium B1221]|nr:sugar transferase [Kiritimatiellaeota bacterium B1221]